MSVFRRQVESETSLLQRAAEWPGHRTLDDLGGEALRETTQQHGIDFATALLFDRLQKSSTHAPFIRRIRELSQVRESFDCGIDARIVIVPGALYRERPDFGGDGRLVREVAESFGLKTDLIPLASCGSVLHNARLIREWLTKHSHEQIVLVSLSKGGADLKMALAGSDAPTSLDHVIAWINVCGPLNGSRMANWILASRLRTWFVRWKFRRQKRDFQFVTDLRHGDGAPLNFPLQLPPSLTMLSLIGFPLQRHMTTRFSRFCHRTLSAHGPNDGTTTLSDVLEWPGEIYPVWGADHYFRPEAMARSLIAAMLRYLGEELAEAHPAVAAIAEC